MVCSEIWRDYLSVIAAAESGIGLVRRFWNADALTIKPGPIEATDASLARSEHIAGAIDPARASFWTLCGSNPVDPVSACDGGDVGPRLVCLRVGRERLVQIRGNLGFRFLLNGHDLQGHYVSSSRAGTFLHGFGDLEPMALLPVWLECRTKRTTVDRAVNGRHPARGKLRTGGLRQDKKGP